ncbi:unnamed protein product, partial [marine sediment metagenome]
MAGFSTPGAAGITKLSELIIDAAPGKAKDIAELILTTQGDVLYRNAEAARLAAEYGVGYNFVHAKNTGVDEPEWMDILDIVTYLTGAVNRMIAPPTLQIPEPDISVAVAEDHSGGGHTADKTLTVPVPTIGKATAACSPSAVGGGVAHDDDGVDTDETTETNSAAADDMHLLPDPGAVGDGFYFGLANPFDWLCLNIGVAGAGVWTITWKYWDGDTWDALTLIGAKDETANF